MKIQLSDHFTFKKLFRFVLPSIVMMVFTSIYGVVDGFFVSNYAGKTAFAAVNLIMPFVMILGGVGFMIGTGGSALVSFQLGEGNKKKANETFSLLVYFTVIVGIIISVIGCLVVEPVALLFGATAEMLPDCVLYGRIVIAFMVTFMIQNAFQSFFVTAEKPRMGLIVTVAAGVGNMVMDFLFIGVFNWGVAGAAVATGLSQTIGCIIPLIYFFLPNSSTLRLSTTHIDWYAIGKACGNGSSELMSNVASSIIGIVYNWQLLKFAGEDGVATYGVLMYVQFIFIAMFVGYAVGSAPIVGYHYGAGNYDEVKNIKNKSLRSMSIGGVSMLILAIVLAPVLSKIFVGYDPDLMEMTTHAFRIFSMFFILAGVNIYASSFFTALGNGLVSAIISFVRVLVFQLLAVMLLPLFFGIDGIWLANTVAEVFSFIVSMTFLIKLRDKYHY